MASNCEVVLDLPEAPETIDTRSAPAAFPSSMSEELVKAEPPFRPPIPDPTRSLVCLYLGNKIKKSLLTQKDEQGGGHDSVR